MYVYSDSPDYTYLINRTRYRPYAFLNGVEYAKCRIDGEWVFIGFRVAPQVSEPEKDWLDINAYAAQTL
jgi:hypothetical protein